jgi:hypothetical protein
MFKALEPSSTTLLIIHCLCILFTECIYVFHIIFRINCGFLSFRSRVSSGSIVSDYGLDDRAIGV